MTNGWLDFIFLQNGFDSKLVYQKQHFWFVWGLKLDNSKTIWGQCLTRLIDPNMWTMSQPNMSRLTILEKY